MKANFLLRLATDSDIPALETLIVISARALMAPYYSPAQIEAAIGPVFGVDHQLIRDRTYFVAECEKLLVGCGGWSRRKALFGGDLHRAGEDVLLDPRYDSARIRAFFTHPAWARRGIGRSILAASESAIRASGFHRVELVATLAGEPLYATFDYSPGERYEVAISGNLTLPVVRMTKRFSSV